MNRREALQTIVGSLGLPMIEVVDYYDFETEGAGILHATEPVKAPEPPTYLAPCAWARAVTEFMTAFKFHRDTMARVVENRLTKDEFYNRLKLVNLPIDIADMVDGGTMTLEMGFILSGSRKPHAYLQYLKPPRKLFPHQIRMLVRFEIFDDFYSKTVPWSNLSHAPQWGVWTTGLGKTQAISRVARRYQPRPDDQREKPAD